MGDCLDVICFEQGLGGSCLILVATVYVPDFEIILVHLHFVFFVNDCFECFCSCIPCVFFCCDYCLLCVGFFFLSTRGNLLRSSGIFSLPFHSSVFLN